MRVIVAVNLVSELNARQTTAMLIASIVAKGCDVFLANVEDFSLSNDQEMCVRAIELPGIHNCTSSDVESFSRSPAEFTIESIHQDDLMMIRTNPGRDLDRRCVHQAFLDLCRVAKSRGVQVVNDPTHLDYFASKDCLAAIDKKFCPETLVSNEHSLIAEFVRNSGGDCVLKPLVGSRGQNVIRVTADHEGLESLIETTYGNDAIVAQYFVTADHLGDKRVVVCGGELLELNGWLGGIERRPAEGDFRANIHAGASPHPLSLSVEARNAAEYAAELLDRHGVWLAGVDLIGNKIIEFNVYSTGGLYFAEQFSGQDFTGEIIDRLLE